MGGMRAQISAGNVDCATCGWRRNALRLQLVVALALVLALDARAVEEPLRKQSVFELAEPSAGEVAQQTLDLELGKSLFMRSGFNIKRVSVGDPEIVDVVVLSSREMQVVPRKIGETNMIVWESGSNPSVILDVAVGSSFTTLERRLSAVLHTDGIRVESVGNAVVLTGSVPSPVMAERAMTMAKAYFPEEENNSRTVVDSLEVGGNQQVMIEVVVAEMSRSLGRRMKVNWDTMIETGIKTFTFTSLLGDLISLADEGESVLVRSGVDFIGTVQDPGNFALTYVVEAAVDNNLAKVLAKPTLMARSGQTASVLVGGEVPIPIAQGGAFGSSRERAQVARLPFERGVRLPGEGHAALGERQGGGVAGLGHQARQPVQGPADGEGAADLLRDGEATLGPGQGLLDVAVDLGERGRASAGPAFALEELPLPSHAQ
jgi:Flp pilus assembly secretin CpaC